MIIAVDFDETVVSQRGRAYEDISTPLQFVVGAKRALLSLKRAGHILILYSGRANRSLRLDPQLDPLVRAGRKLINMDRWIQNQPVNEARYQQMLNFVATELPDVFDAVDDGVQGKPGADLFIDDKALRLGHGAHAALWYNVGVMYGELFYGGDDGQAAQA